LRAWELLFCGLLLEDAKAMEILNKKLAGLSQKLEKGEPVNVAIFGLGSVGTYLLEYIVSLADRNIQVTVAGRNLEKMERTVNIVKTAATIRGCLATKIDLKQLDLHKIHDIEQTIATTQPDFIVNSSRVLSGLKYGSISWHSVRAYGIWAPLAMKLVRNIMEGYRNSGSQAIVVNTSYADVTNPWLKSAQRAYPDFGSGNFNHIVPRMKFVIARDYDIDDYNDIDITFATSHFHDVLICKEGVTEGIEPLLHVIYQGKELHVDRAVLYKQCAIPMPTDQKRNMMNASSNFEIITKILDAIGKKKRVVIHTPGVVGNLGGYPVYIDFTEEADGNHVGFVEDYFSLEAMRTHNRDSIYLDGIEDIAYGTLTYTDALRQKATDAFQVDLPKHVRFGEIDQTGKYLVERVINPALKANK
jgi:hypothetical protein